MGVDYMVYVGAYLVIDAEPIEYLDGPFCPNGHGRTPTDFCPRCGAKTRKMTQIRAAWLHDLTDREDELSQLNGEWGPADHVILAVGNQKKDLPDRICHLDRNEFEAIPILPGNISQMVNNLETNYAEIIAELRQVADVDIHFGIITYAM